MRLPSIGSTPLNSTHFAADGQRGWAVGDAGTILQTKDGGAKWISISIYRRAPAPAYVVFLALTVVPLSFALGKPREPPAGDWSIANAYVSDGVLTAEEAAGTQVGAIAEGLASYLENPKTQAPLVIGITGAWGSGKSSLMNLLREALRARGFQTAWFNAWHHQSEEHLFASLLASLRSNALLPWWTPRGIRARGRLSIERFGRMWLRLVFGLAGAVFTCTVVWKLNVESDKILEWSSFDKILASLAIPAGLLPVIALWKVFSAFGAEPTKLTKSLRGATAAEAREATSFRQRFAEEFGEVTRALQPQTLTLFIDDLDRCHPDQTVIVLEAINFLATSGPCYIVLAMEQKVLIHCLEKKLDWLQDLEPPERALEGTSRAQLWLEKLVQMRLYMAPLSSGELQSLINTRSQRDGRMKRPPSSDLSRIGTRIPHFLKSAARILSIAALVFAVGAVAWQFGEWFANRSKPMAEEKTEKPPAWFSEVELAGKVNNTDVILGIQPRNADLKRPVLPTSSPSTTPSPSPTPSPPKQVSPVTIQHGQNATPNWGWMIVAGLLVLGGALRVFAIRDLSSVSDSPKFTSTLSYFTPCIVAACETPRAVKWLINRVRLYAMLLRHWSLEKGAPHNSEKGPMMGQEGNLVIFGILEKLCPKQLSAAIADPPNATFNLECIRPGLEKFNEDAAQAIRSLASPEFREDFDRLVRAIEIE
jgi:hypothetical protein